MTDEVNKGRHVFTVNVGRDCHELEVQADDFHVDSDGIHFFTEPDPQNPEGVTRCFVSHPAVVRVGRQDRSPEALK